MSVKVKICGITNLEDALFCSRAGADALGFNFYPKSPRYIAPSDCWKIVAALPPFISKVGVFVNEDEKTVQKIDSELGLDYLQFHGNEGPEYCRLFGAKALKVFRIDEKIQPEQYDFLSAFLFDSPHHGQYGGTGTVFEWSQIPDIGGLNKPVILSGGLGVDNVVRAVEIVKPYGVDASSRLESSPGIKNHAWVKEFIVRAKGEPT